MQWWFYAHETRQKTIKNALFHARLLILPQNNTFSLKICLQCHQKVITIKEGRL